MTSSDVVTVTTLVAVDPATAFRVFTEEVDAWWKRGPRHRAAPASVSVMRFEPGPGGRLLEVCDPAEGGTFLVGPVLAWDPPRRLVFQWRDRSFAPGETTEVEVRFDAHAQGTRVTLEHRGWDRVPRRHPARAGLFGPAFTAMIGHRWAERLVELRARASGG